MNRRGFISSVGAVVTATLLPELPEPPKLIDLRSAIRAKWRSDSFTTEQMAFAGRTAANYYWHKPDIIVASETFKKLFDECVSSE